MSDRGLCWLVIVAGLLSAWISIVYLPVENWDEARRAVNALEMNCRGDYLDYYYLGAPDTFNTKPPLFVWLVAVTFKLLGPGVIALRLPSFLALAALLVYLRPWFTRRFGPHLAFMLLAALVSVNGIIGHHVGISGDTDMLFTLFVTVCLLEFYAFLESGARVRLCWSVGAFCLAVLTKGVAVMLVVPGTLVAVLLHPNLYYRLTPRQWLPAALLLISGLTAATYLLSQMGQATLPQAGYANLLQATFLRDGLQRLTDAGFEPAHHPFYIFEVLDTRFGLLIYGLYGFLVVAVVRFGIGGLWARLQRHFFGVFSLCIVVSVLGLLQWSESKHDWYVAPAVPFLAYLFARGLGVFLTRRSWRVGVMLLVVSWGIFGRGTQVQSKRSNEPSLPVALAERVGAADSLLVDPHLPQALAFRILLTAGRGGCQVGMLPAGASVEDCDLLLGRYGVCYE